MKQIVIEAREDRDIPEGGHVVVLLRGLSGSDGFATYRLKAIDPPQALASGVRWPGGERAPVSVRQTPHGVEVVVGPDVVDHPLLLAGTGVVIEIPGADVRGEFLWPDAMPSAQPRRRRVTARLHAVSDPSAATGVPPTVRVPAAAPGPQAAPVADGVAKPAMPVVRPAAASLAAAAATVGPVHVAVRPTLRREGAPPPVPAIKALTPAAAHLAAVAVVAVPEVDRAVSRGSVSGGIAAAAVAPSAPPQNETPVVAHVAAVTAARATIPTEPLDAVASADEHVLGMDHAASTKAAGPDAAQRQGLGAPPRGEPLATLYLIRDRLPPRLLPFATPRHLLIGSATLLVGMATALMALPHRAAPAAEGPPQAKAGFVFKDPRKLRGGGDAAATIVVPAAAKASVRADQRAAQSPQRGSQPGSAGSPQASAGSSTPAVLPGTPGGAGTGAGGLGGNASGNAAAPQTVAAAAPVKDPCGTASVTTEAKSGGVMGAIIQAPCRKAQDVVLSYGGLEFTRRTDAQGTLAFLLDCIFGAGPALDVTFADGSKTSVPVTARDLDQVAKVALVWHAPVNLDLHVYEAPGLPGTPGQVSAADPGSAASALDRVHQEGRPHGFMSSTDDGRADGGGGGGGAKLEAYTLFYPDRPTGQVAVGLAVDFESRGAQPQGATCLGGAWAEIDYEIIRRTRSGQITREPGEFAALPCGATVPDAVRFNPALLSPLRVVK